MLWHKIIDTARYTPSPHNVQPWKIKIIDETRAELFIDRSRTLPAEDVTGNFIVSAMGMFLEALRIVALNEGRGFRYELIDAPDSAMKPFAHLFLEPKSSFSSPYSNEIFLKRRTSRVSSKHQNIPAEAVHRLSSLAKQWGQNFNFIDDPFEISEIIETNITAVFDDLNDLPYHEEIVSWFRYSSREGEAKKDGLEARCMKIPPIEFYLFAKLPFIFKIPGLSRAAHLHYRKRIGYVHTLGFISGPFWDKKLALDSGAFLINIWLEMTKHDLFIHPFGNLVTNKKANQWIHERTKLENIWLIFRVGFSEPAPQSHRLNLEDILIDTNN